MALEITSTTAITLILQTMFILQSSRY